MADSSVKRLVFIVSSFEPDVGGDVRLVANQARALAGRGWDVTILTRRPHKPAPRQESLDGLLVVRRGRVGRQRLHMASALLGWTLWLLRRRRTIAVAHVVMVPDFLIPVWATGLMNRSVLQWITDGDVARSLASRERWLGSVQIRIRRWLTARALNVSLTESMSRELDEVALCPGAVIPLGVDTQRLQPPDHETRTAQRATHGVAAGDVVILFVGHLEPRKCVDRLIRAAALLPRACSWKLWLVGDEHRGQPYRRDLEQLIAELDIEASVSFIGAVHDVEGYFRAADIFAIASEREGLPNVLLEAMAHGLPCVAPLSAGGGELLAGGAGSVTETNDPEEIGLELRALVDDAEFRKHLGSRARAEVERYSLGRIADGYERLYRELPYGKPPAQRHLLRADRPREPAT